MVVEERYSEVFRLTFVRPAVVADALAECQVRWPSVPIVFCETRKLAQEWTYRFLAAAQRGLAEDGSGPTWSTPSWPVANCRPSSPRLPRSGPGQHSTARAVSDRQVGSRRSRRRTARAAADAPTRRRDLRIRLVALVGWPRSTATSVTCR